MADTEQPALLAFAPAEVPDALRAHARWVLWRAVWVPERKKYDKIPVFSKPPHNGLSTNEPQHWSTWDAALAAYKDARAHGNPQGITGLGYVMTGAHDIVGVDLDHCIADGVIADWAKEIITFLDSYTEVSPSGRGLRIFAYGAMPDGDFTNHVEHIEVYVGSAARFLTVTGAHLPGMPTTINPIDEATLNALRHRYAKPRAKHDDIPVPEYVDELFLPELPGLHLPDRARAFLESGAHDGDRSAMLQYAAVALFSEGLAAAEVFTILAQNEHCMAVAMDHRRQDPDRAIEYLWVEHCLKPEAKSLAKTADFEAIADDLPKLVQSKNSNENNELGFVDITGGPETVQADSPLVRSETVQAAPKPAGPFPLITLIDFLKRQPPVWLIKGVLPKAALGVLFGKTGSGKTFAALDMAMALARGVDWRGRKTKRVRVAYVAAEGVGGFRNRVDAYCRYHNLDPFEFDEWFRVIERAPNLMEKKDALDLAKCLVGWGHVGLVIVDTLAQVTPGANENAGDDMGKALSHCRGLHTATRAMILLIHHSGKDESKGARGWSGLKAAADVELEVTEDNHVRHLEVTKQKDGEAGLRFGFGLLKVPLGLDEDGEVFDSCVTIEQATVEKKIKGAPGGALGEYALCLVAVVEDFRRDQTSGIKVAAVLAEALRRLPVGDNSERNRKDSLARAWRKLIKNEVFEVEDGCLIDGE